MNPQELKDLQEKIQRDRQNNFPDATKLYLHPDTMSSLIKYSEGTTSIAGNFLGMDMIARDDLAEDDYHME